MSYGWCPCCRGEVDFDWYEDACDECSIAILRGIYTADVHGHEMSRDQLEALDRTEH